MQDYIASLNFGYKVQLREKHVDYKNVLGSFLDPHTIECVDKKVHREMHSVYLLPLQRRDGRANEPKSLAVALWWL
jgi:hypothetical protein